MIEKQDLYYAARTLFERALAIDPNYADALAGDAMTYQVDYLYGWSLRRDRLGEGKRHRSGRPKPSRSHPTTLVRTIQRDTYTTHDGIARTNRFRSPTMTHWRPTQILPNSTAPEAKLKSRSAVLTKRYLTLSKPSDLARAIRKSARWYVIIGDAEVGLGRLDAAIEEYRKAIDTGYRNRVVNMAGVYALQGKMEEAKSVLAEALRANPKLSVKMLTERAAVPPALAEGLRKAGLGGTVSECNVLTATR